MSWLMRRVRTPALTRLPLALRTARSRRVGAALVLATATGAGAGKAATKRSAEQELDADDDEIPMNRPAAGARAGSGGGALTTADVLAREKYDAARALAEEEEKILAGEFVRGETASQRIWRHFKAEPWVGIGAFATAGVLIGGFFYAYLPGKRHLYQRIWWTRIGLQAFTAASLVAGALWREKKRRDELPQKIAENAPVTGPAAAAAKKA